MPIYAPGRIIVVFDSQLTSRERETIITRQGHSIISSNDRSCRYTVRVADGTEEQSAQQYRVLPGITAAELAYERHISS